MKKQISRLSLFLSISLLMACAKTYYPINPPSVNYNAHDISDGIAISYRHDVLRESGNKRYSAKEDKRGIRLVAVKLTNNTSSPINVGRDLIFYSGQNQVNPIDPNTIKKALGQNVPSYLAYMLLTFTNLYVTNGSTTQTYPIGLILGPAVTAGNMAMAGSSNKKMLDELLTYDIVSKELRQGESAYGLIGIRDMGYSPISVKLRED